jgi:hypothetical protein
MREAQTMWSGLVSLSGQRMKAYVRAVVAPDFRDAGRKVESEFVERRAGDVHSENDVRRRVNLQINLIDAAPARRPRDIITPSSDQASISNAPAREI